MGCARYGDAAHLPGKLLAELLPGPVTVLLARRLDAPLCAALNPGITTIGEAVPPLPSYMGATDNCINDMLPTVISAWSTKWFCRACHD